MGLCSSAVWLEGDGTNGAEAHFGDEPSIPGMASGP